MKYLITGLGNPGAEYEFTRHNIGFLVLDALAAEAGISFMPDRFGLIAEGRLKNKQIVLLKPDTYMNLSGKAVRYWMQAKDIPLEQTIVVTDDLALPLGKLRMKTKGSAGGHNGLKSIAELLQTENYPRLRFGIGDNFSKGKQVDFVLGTWNKSEQEIIKNQIPMAVDALKSFIFVGISKTMELHNR
jgi:PTH1 family peptidyl-tRNA hydrolase